MSQRVTQDSEMPARMGPLPHDVRQATYIPRPGAEHSRKLFQDISVVDGFQLPQIFSKPVTENSISAPSDSLPAVSEQIDDVKQRQPLQVVPHKPEPSKVLKRESFAAPPQVAVSYVKRSFDPPINVRRTRLTGLSGSAGQVVMRIRRSLVALPSRHKVALSMAALVLVMGSGFSLAGLSTNDLGQISAAKATIAAAVPATTTDSDNNAPNTASITADSLRSYKVTPEAPRYIRIGKFGVIARVLEVGVTKEGALGSPSNIFDTAWYKDSAQPGKPGVTLIAGHISSGTTNGAFYDIKNLVVGDNIEVEKGDGTKLSYSVVQVKSIPKDTVDMKSLMMPLTTGVSGLNLITYGGKYDAKSDDFSERIAVYASIN